MLIKGNKLTTIAEYEIFTSAAVKVVMGARTLRINGKKSVAAFA